MKRIYYLLVCLALCCATVRAEAPAYKVLVLTERGGQHGGFTDAAIRWLGKQSQELNFEFTEINHTQVVNEAYLSGFRLIIQLDYPPYSWTKEAEKAFTRYIDEGRGGWIGFHHATLLGEFDGYPLWHWFSDFMGGIRFRNYIAAKADATVRVEETGHPVMQGVDLSFEIPDDEWYTFDKNPRPNVQVLAHVDEASYQPASDIRMGDHPVVWVNPHKAARNVYFLMGHSGKLFDSKDFTTMFSNAIAWASATDARTHYPAHYAQAPRFKALVYYSEQVEEAHRRFAEQGVEFFRRLHYGNGFTLEVTQTLAGYPYEKLKEYDVVVMLNNAPSADDEREAFRLYMEIGGGWMGFHAAAYNDKNTNWPWFVDFLGGGAFLCNNWPPQPAKLSVDYPEHPVTRNLPASFIAPESEWYQWSPSPRKNPEVDVLLSLSPDNYPIGIKDVVSSGDYPIVWTHKKYRMVYLNMGHGDDEFTDATQKLLFINAFRWVLSTNPSGDPFKRSKPIRLAFISGMNPQFNAELYAPLLNGFEGVTWKAYTNEESQELFKPENTHRYDVMVFHDICLDEIPESTQQHIQDAVSNGKPVFILHDGLLTYNTWPEFARIAGMKYFMSSQEVDGRMHRVSTYKHEQDIPIEVADPNHFITRGMDKRFILHDEIYGHMWRSPDVHVLWTTTHPASDAEVLYTHQYGKGKVVGLVTGHGPDVFRDRNYRLAFRRSILWLTNP